MIYIMIVSVKVILLYTFDCVTSLCRISKYVYLLHSDTYEYILARNQYIIHAFHWVSLMVKSSLESGNTIERPDMVLLPAKSEF